SSGEELLLLLRSRFNGESVGIREFFLACQQKRSIPRPWLATSVHFCVLTAETKKWQAFGNSKIHLKGRPAMARHEFQSEAAVWIIAGREREPDEVQKELVAVALRVWPRAEAYARRELHERGLADETTIILQAWEDALQSVQRSLRRKFRLTRIHN